MARDSRTWIELSSTALRHNFAVIFRLVGPTVGIMPIVKANAYGHGLSPVMKILRQQPHWGVGVAYGDEALQLRASGYRGRILVLSYWRPVDGPELVRQRIELVVWDRPSWQAIERIGRRSAKRPRIHLKLDTGTTRIGFTLADLIWLHQELQRKKYFQLIGVFTHLANAEEQTTARTKQQLKRFTTLKSTLHLPAGIEAHAACTAAILRYPEARFGLVRLGIGLYGLWPSEQMRTWSRANLPKLSLRPVLAWKTRLAQVKTIPAGTGIGYGSTVIAKRRMRVGIVPVGYADGLDRRLSNNGWVMIDGQRAPIIGRVCMNLTMVNLTRMKRSRANDVVTIIGTGVSFDDWATWTKTINYELVSRLSPTIERCLR